MTDFKGIHEALKRLAELADGVDVGTAKLSIGQMRCLDQMPSILRSWLRSFPDPDEAAKILEAEKQMKQQQIEDLEAQLEQLRNQEGAGEIKHEMSYSEPVEGDAS